MREESGVTDAGVSLPSSGGGIAPLGDRFQPDLVRGTGNYAVPLHLPKGPNESCPQLTLAYSTGAGNGPFGVGWQLNVGRIERTTDRGVPRYDDGDTFSIGGQDTLVPVGGGRYRPSSDTSFAYVDRVGDGWRVRSGEGRTQLFGQSDASREGSGARVFAWYLDEELDAAGNAVRYRYLRDQGRLYIQEIAWSIFRLEFLYGARNDVVRNGRAGFLRTTALRLVSTELHCDRAAPSLLRTYRFTYVEAVNGSSLLTRLSLEGERDGERASFPPLTFEYSSVDFTAYRVHELQALVPPPALDDPDTQLVDMTGDGLPDILVSAAGGMRLWRNRGDGWLEGPFPIPDIPSTVRFDRQNVALADLNGNGRADLFAVDQPVALAFEADGHGGFSPQPIVFQQHPTLNLASSDTRLMDVDGDGVTDLIRTGRGAFLLFRHEPGVGWNDPERVARVADLSQFPDVSFADRDIALADMTGDGLQDFVWVNSGHVVYWPYFGNGAWGAQIEMERPPRFPEGFLRDRLKIVDLDGDGCADIIYCDADRTLIWINQCGGAFAPPIEIPVAPTANRRLLAADVFGDGRPGIAWPARRAVDEGTGYRVLRFDGGRAPYLLTTIDNGMGGISTVTYSTTTAMRLRDEVGGRAWTGQLPMVVQVASGLSERETITARTVTRAFRYHDGVYDGPRREFRGFAAVTVDSAGDDSIPSTRQELEYFQGDPDAVDPAESARQRAMAGALVATRLFEKRSSGWMLLQDSTQQWDARVEFQTPGASVHFPFLHSIETREHSQSDGTAVRVDRAVYGGYDAFGNVGIRTRESFAQDAPDQTPITSDEHFTYVKNVANWIVKPQATAVTYDTSGKPFAATANYYDGAAFVGLPATQATAGLLTRSEELRLIDAKLPPDYLGSRDFAALGYKHHAIADAIGYYATTFSVRRDSHGNVVEQRDALGAPLTFEYDADGVFPLRTKDALGRTAVTAFDLHAVAASRVDFADGRSVRYEYDAVGRQRASYEADDAGVEQMVKCWLVDLASRPVRLIAIAPETSGRRVEEFSLQTAFEGLADVGVSCAYYDGFGQVALQVSRGADGPGGEARYMTANRQLLNVRGLVRSEFPPEFVPTLGYTPAPPADRRTVQFHYDGLGQREDTLGPADVRHRVVRDTFSITHFEGKAAGDANADPTGPACRVERFDTRARIRRIEEAVGDGTFLSTSYDLTQNGRIESVRDNDGALVVHYVFAGCDQMVRIESREAGTRTYYRDAANRSRECVHADASRLFYHFDALGRMTSIESVPAGGGPPTTLRQILLDADPSRPSGTLFLDGRVAAIREADYTLQYAYNRAGKVVSEIMTVDGATLTTAREYTLQGRTIATIYPDGFRLEHAYDSAAVATALPGVLSGATHDADGTLTGYKFVNGVAVTMSRDADTRRLVECSAQRGSTMLRRLAYTYEPMGDIASIRDEIAGDVEFSQYTYDSMHRLVRWTRRQSDAGGAVLQDCAYDYDAVGNLRGLGELQPVSLAYQDATHPGRVTSVASQTATDTIAYEGRGHMRAFGALNTLEFDALDRLVHVQKADGTDLRFVCDAQGRRVLKRISRGGTTHTVRYAGALYEDHGDHTVRHIFFGGTRVASTTVRNNATDVQTACYLGDRHGTLLMATNATGTVVQQQRYTPFGAPRDNGMPLDSYLGRDRDAETGLLLLGARYYAVTIGRFISPDWFVLENPHRAARIPQAFNVYSYAINNPLLFKDPSGMWFVLALIIVAAVGFAVGFIYGLATGQSFGHSLLTGLETGLLAAAGFTLGYAAGAGLGTGAAYLGIGWFPSAGTLGAIGATSGALNGTLSGMRGIYDWTSPSGYAAFAADSTWGLLGTSLGNVVQLINIAMGANYDKGESFRKNRTVYDDGVYVIKADAFTLGNVTSNAFTDQGMIDGDLINKHERLHINQNRIFGPLMQLTYVVWGLGGLIVGSIAWGFNRDHSWSDLVETAAYYDNPFEYWSYNKQGNWPPGGPTGHGNGFDPLLGW